MKKAISLMIALALLLSVLSLTALAEEKKTIKMMCDTTVVTPDNGLAEFEARWEEITGANLEVIQPDHSGYYDALQATIASGDIPDVMIMSSTYYSEYANAGFLWDMTDAWENSATKNSGRFFGDSVIDGLKINDRLYGFAPTRGNGCVIYIKQAWLDAVGMEAPKTFDEYLKVCEAFATKDPDGNGQNDTYALGAAGFIGNEAPFVNYLPEFYQDAYPYFIQLDDGTWVDGFTQDSMKDALIRIADAVKAGYIDPETLTNTTADTRNKFYDDKTGIFTYWAGTWATNLKTNLENNGKSGELAALAPLEGMPAYYDRVPPVWAIYAGAEDPQFVFDTFIDTMLDGGDMMFLWTYGVEGFHWSRAAETVLEGTEKAKTYAEGEFHMLESKGAPGTLYTRATFDPMLRLASFAEGYEDPSAVTVAPEARAAQELFNNNSRLATIVPTTEEMSEFGGDLTSLKSEIAANIALGTYSYEEGMKIFEEEGGLEWSNLIVESLNALQ